MGQVVDLAQLEEHALYNVTLKQRAAYIRALAPLLESALVDYGPMPSSALRYFMTRDHGLKLGRDEYQIVLANRRSMFREYEYGDDETCWYTIQQDKDNVEPRLRIPEDYEQSYFELLAYVQLVQDNPEYASAPLDKLRQLRVI